MRKKLQIRVPKRAPALDVAEAWPVTLEPAVNQILARDPSPLSFEQLYHTVYRLVEQEHGKQLYRRLCDHIRAYLGREIAPIVEKNTSLGVVSAQWSAFAMALAKIEDMFKYLDRSVCDMARLPRVDAAGQSLFRDVVLNSAVQEAVHKAVITDVNSEREGQLVNTAALRTVIEMLETLSDSQTTTASLFDAYTRPLLVESTQQFYQRHVDALLKSDRSSSDMLQDISTWLDKEAGTGALYLPGDTPHELLRTVETEVVGPALPLIWGQSSGIDEWVARGDIPALKLSAELEQRCQPEGAAQAASPLVDRVAHAAAIAQLAVNDSQTQPDTWVAATLDTRRHFDTLSAALGRGLSAVRMAATQAANRCTRMPEFLATYLDALLRKGASASSRSDSDVEAGLDAALVLFDALEEPDRFASHFKRQLARRLLQHKSRSEDLEYSWLRRLRASDHGGPQYVFAFQRMLKDMRLSHDANGRWRDDCEDLSVKTNVNVLAKMVWPLQYLPADQSQVNVPRELSDVRSEFAQWYSHAHFRRKLQWNLGLATVDVKINVGDGPGYMANMPAVTLAILSQFGGDEQITVAELSKRTNVALGGELERHLLPLVNPSGRTPHLLLKIPAEPPSHIAPEDILTFNNSFHSPTPRFRVQAVAAKRSAPPGSDDRQLEQDRLQKAQAAIVRVMKARRTLGHASLVQETAGLLARHFRASPQTIKRAIQQLLDKEYLRRGEDPQIYEYVA